VRVARLSPGRAVKNIWLRRASSPASRKVVGKPSVKPKPVTPKAARPSAPQAKPAQTVTPPQPTPPPAPPAVAKVEIPPSPAQPPVKVAPPPAPVQQHVKSQPQASPPPVQQPAVTKKAETPQTGLQPKEVAAAKTVPHVSASGIAYPYSVYLESVQSIDYAIKGLSSVELNSRGIKSEIVER